MSDEMVIDLTWARNALFVRQTIAKSFGIPLDREFTWDSLQTLICFSGNPKIPAKIAVFGLAGLGVSLPRETEKFSAFLRALKMARPDVDVRVRLH